MISNSVPCGGARCKRRRCRPCHSARKSLRGWFVRANRGAEWEAMSVEEKRQAVVDNKDKGQGRGIKREHKVKEKVECSDKMGLGQTKPFLTRKQLHDSKSTLHVCYPRRLTAHIYTHTHVRVLLYETSDCVQPDPDFPQTLISIQGSFKLSKNATIGRMRTMRLNGRPLSQTRMLFGRMTATMNLCARC